MSKFFAGVGTFKVEGENAVLSGVNSFSGGEYNELEILGVNSINGKIKVNELKIEGICNTKSLVEANKLVLHGVANTDGNIRVHEAVITGMLSMGSGHFEADKINCKGMIQTKGEINADELIAEGSSIQGRDIYGDKVIIHTENKGYNLYSSLKAKLKGENSQCGSRVKNIEATEIDLINVEAEAVSGTNVTIGKGCHIDCVDCDGILTIDPTATVKAVTGNYTRSDVAPYPAASEEAGELKREQQSAAEPETEQAVELQPEAVEGQVPAEETKSEQAD